MIKKETLFFSFLKSNFPPFLQHLVKIKTRKRSWMMRVIARRSPSQHSWDPPYGTKPFPMTEILSSWNTWTWRSFCRKMAFPPARPSMTTALTLPGCSRLPPRPPPSWTSAVGPLHPFTLASRPRTACRAPSDQVNSKRFSLHMGKRVKGRDRVGRNSGGGRGHKYLHSQGDWLAVKEEACISLTALIVPHQ